MSIRTNLPNNPNVEIIKANESGIFTNCIFKAIPVAFDESMSYYETLCGLLYYLKNVIIPTVNNNAEAVAELQVLYEQLRSYVENYFTNLDVQEEINNKLDEMVEDGTLQNVLMNYTSIQKVYNTHQEMMEDENLIKNMKIKTLGYYSINDGGGANYYITDTEIENKYQEQKGNLFITLINDTFVKPEQLGAYGDNTHDDYIPLNTLLNYGFDIELNTNKKYLFSNTLVINKPIYLNGNNATLHYNGNATAISVTSSGDLHVSDRGIIKNLIINAENSDKVINWNYSIKSLLRNIKIYNFNHYGIYVEQAGYETRFENIYFACKKRGDTIAIYGNISDMDFGALYGVNVKNFLNISNCATHIEMIHAWCANIDLFNEEHMTDDEYNYWYEHTTMITFRQNANTYPLVIDYLYADTYYNVFYYQSYHRHIIINNLIYRKSKNLLKYEQEFKPYIIYTMINNLDITETELTNNGLLTTSNIYPSIKNINGFNVSKAREITIQNNTVDVPVDNIIPYTIKQNGALNIRLKNIVGLPAIYSVNDYGANCKTMFPFINTNGIDIDYSNSEDIPSSEYNVRFYLKAKPLQRGELFKYIINDNTIE